VADWHWLLADLRTGTITAEIPLAGAKPSKRLGASGSINGAWALEKKFQGDPYVLTTPARTAIYAYRDGRPWWGGIVWTRTYDSDKQTVSLGAADFWSFFDHRKLLPLLDAAPAVDHVASKTVTYTAVEQNQIARNLVALAQSHTGGDIGIVVDQHDTGIVRDCTYEGYDLADVGEALRQLSKVIDGPDMMFDVAGPDAQGRPIRMLRLGNPHLGQQGSPWVFEAGGNLLSWTWASDGTRMTTRGYAVGSGSERGQIIAVAEDTDVYNDGWPLLETDANYSTVEQAGTLQGHADADQQAARLPVVTATLVVRGDGRNSRNVVVGPSLGDYNPGDDARVVVPAGDLFIRQGIDTTMRIVGIDVDPDGDVEKAALLMNPLLDDAV
jgi:hypothetical protein